MQEAEEDTGGYTPAEREKQMAEDPETDSEQFQTGRLAPDTEIPASRTTGNLPGGEAAQENILGQDESGL